MKDFTVREIRYLYTCFCHNLMQKKKTLTFHTYFFKCIIKFSKNRLAIVQTSARIDLSANFISTAANHARDLVFSRVDAIYVFFAVAFRNCASIARSLKFAIVNSAAKCVLVSSPNHRTPSQCMN